MPPNRGYPEFTSRASDGLPVKADVRIIGKLHARFGSADDPSLVHFCAEGALGAASCTGRGERIVGTADYPEAGITWVGCLLHRSDLPRHYPAGCTQPSIATIRLCKRREAS
jgi:hypothetical protein